MRFDFRLLVNCILNFNFQRATAVAVSAVVFKLVASLPLPLSLLLFNNKNSTSFLLPSCLLIYLHFPSYFSLCYCCPLSMSLWCCNLPGQLGDFPCKKYWLLNVLRICDLICDSDACASASSSHLAAITVAARRSVKVVLLFVHLLP